MAGTSAIRAGSAFVELFADTSQLSKGLRAAQDQLKGWGEGLQAIGSQVYDAGRAGLDFFSSALHTFADTGTHLHELSERTGLSVESLGQLGYAAEQSGLSVDDVGQSVMRMQRTLNQAAQGSGTANEALQELGTSVEELKGMDPDEQFQILAKSIEGVEDPTKRTALAMQLFGRSGGRMLSMFKDMDQLRDRATQLGLVLGRDDTDAAHELTKAFHDVAAVTKAVYTQIGAALAPAVTSLATQLANGIAYVVQFVKANKPLVILAAEIAAGLVVVGGVIAAAGVAIIGLGAVLGSLTTVAAGAIGILGALFTAIMTPGLVVAAVVLGAAAALIYFSGAGSAALQYLGEQFSGLFTTASEAWQGIKDALAAGNFELAARIAWLGVKAAVLENTQALQVAILQFVADVKTVWVALTDTLQRAWAAFINASLTALQPWALAVSAIFDALGAHLTAATIAMQALNVEFAKAPDMMETAKQLADIAEERRNAPARVGGAAEEARFEFNAARRRAANEAADAARRQADAAEQIAAGAKAANQLSDVAQRGTFNPFAAGALTGADKLAGVEKHTKKGAKHLENIERKLDDLDELGP
jgi:hypothetical protein